MRIGISQNVSNFFLAKTDMTRNKNTNKVAAFMDKGAAFFLKPARDLLGGSSSKVSENKIQLKHQRLDYSAYVNRGSQGGTLAKIAKVVALVPGLVIGGALELVPFLFSSNIREIKAHTAEIDQMTILDKRKEHVAQLADDLKSVMEQQDAPDFREQLEKVVGDIQELYHGTDRHEARTEQMSIVQPFYESLNPKELELMILNDEHYDGAFARYENAAVTVAAQLTLLLVPEMNRGAPKMVLRDKMVDQMLKDLTSLKKAKIKIAEGNKHKKEAKAIRKKANEIKEKVGLESAQLKQFFENAGITAKDILNSSVDEIINRLGTDEPQ